MRGWFSDNKDKILEVIKGQKSGWNVLYYITYIIELRGQLEEMYQQSLEITWSDENEDMSADAAIDYGVTAFSSLSEIFERMQAFDDTKLNNALNSTDIGEFEEGISDFCEELITTYESLLEWKIDFIDATIPNVYKFFFAPLIKLGSDVIEQFEDFFNKMQVGGETILFRAENDDEYDLKDIDLDMVFNIDNEALEAILPGFKLALVGLYAERIEESGILNQLDTDDNDAEVDAEHIDVSRETKFDEVLKSLTERKKAE